MHKDESSPVNGKIQISDNPEYAIAQPNPALAADSLPLRLKSPRYAFINNQGTRIQFYD